MLGTFCSSETMTLVVSSSVERAYEEGDFSLNVCYCMPKILTSIMQHAVDQQNYTV